MPCADCMTGVQIMSILIWERWMHHRIRIRWMGKRGCSHSKNMRSKVRDVFFSLRWCLPAPGRRCTGAPETYLFYSAVWHLTADLFLFCTISHLSECMWMEPFRHRPSWYSAVLRPLFLVTCQHVCSSKIGAHRLCTVSREVCVRFLFI